MRGELVYGNVVPLVNYHFLQITPVQTAKPWSEGGLSESLIFNTCR